MPARPKTSTEGKAIQPGHGKHGYARVGVDVEPGQKDRLVERATRTHTSVSAIVRAAIDRYLGPA